MIYCDICWLVSFRRQEIGYVTIESFHGNWSDAGGSGLLAEPGTPAEPSSTTDHSTTSRGSGGSSIDPD